MEETPAGRLRWARERAKLATAVAAAKKHGWNENTYKSHENGARGYRLPDAEKYARAFKISATWLLTGETHALSKDERDFLESVRQLSPAHRGIVEDLVLSLSKETPASPPPAIEATVSKKSSAGRRRA